MTCRGSGSFAGGFNSHSSGGKMVLPHNSVCRMTREQSRRILRWNPADPVPGKLYRNQRTRACPGGLWIVHADLFNAYRMDERFEGWGCEDTEFLRRIPWRRLPGPLSHIWHAKASKESLRRNRRLLRIGNVRRNRTKIGNAQKPPHMA